MEDRGWRPCPKQGLKGLDYEVSETFRSTGAGHSLPIPLPVGTPVPICPLGGGGGGAAFSGLQRPWLKTEVIWCHCLVLCFCF